MHIHPMIWMPEFPIAPVCVGKKSGSQTVHIIITYPTTRVFSEFNVALELEVIESGRKRQRIRGGKLVVVPRRSGSEEITLTPVVPSVTTAVAFALTQR